MILLIFLCLALTTNAAKPMIDQAPKQFMGPQNEARKAVGLKALVWSKKLTGYATWYAGQRQADCALKHSGTEKYGENIFWGSGHDWTAEDAAKAWVNESQWYNYASNSCADGQMCGHYTQIVWRDTKKIGCARVDCEHDEGVFMTCNYHPPGNYYGERPY